VEDGKVRELTRQKEVRKMMAGPISSFQLINLLSLFFFDDNGTLKVAHRQH
jgi:hypothetical protein